jgi:hypothetical protein
LDNKTIEKVKKKKAYDKLLFQITQYCLSNSELPENLIKEAEELGRQLDIQETELQNIGSSTF